MNKQELIATLAEKTDVTKKQAEQSINALIEIVGDTLQAGEKIQLIGFGTFETKQRAARQGRNPKDPQQIINIPAKTVPVFKAGKQLKDKVK